MTRLGVLGWPVAHSRSPAMHNAALRELGLEGWSYQRLPVPPELFRETVRALGGAGFLGANVTIPHKEAAFELADDPSEVARAIGAANTLTFAPDGRIAAENTDAPGLIGAMERAGHHPRGLTAMVLGAGGSARATVWALREAGAREVAIHSRNRERARELARAQDARAMALPERADILINCTPVGLVRPASGGESDLNQLRLTHDLVGRYSYVVDLVYREGTTELLAAAREQGRPVLDGLEVLVAQGALSLEQWTGRPAPVEVMRRAGRSPIGREAPIDS
jgi:shikimate dehydrogenase